MNRCITWSPRHLVRGAIAALALAALPAWAATCYIKPGASGSGAEWANAASLRSALANSGCNPIWVAQGDYTDTTTTGASFVIARPLQLYGGFVGDESVMPATRDPSTTRLQGTGTRTVLALTGGAGAQGLTSTNTVVDGFTISNGGGSGTSPVRYGGGVSCTASSANALCAPTLQNLIITNNRAGYGAGLSTWADWNGATANPKLRDVVFSGNVASTLGGAMYTYNGNPSSVSSPTIDNVTFSNNSAAQGGAIFFQNSSGAANPSITNSTFHGNSAVGGGGRLAMGGAIYNHGLSGTQKLRLTNVTFGANQAAVTNGSGAAFYNVSTPANQPEITNSVFWGNQANSPAVASDLAIANSTSGVLVTNSVMQTTCGTSNTCTNVTATDPQLGPLSSNGGLGQTLLPGAPPADMKKGQSCPATDQRGVVRPSSNCYMGAVERVVAQVTLSASGPGQLSLPGPNGCSTAGAGTCSVYVDVTSPATSVSFEATADAFAQVLSWGGACASVSASSTTCSLPISGDTHVSAAFQSASHTVGGTVSGANGAVVLQNNGGDNLSLPGNGAFTFGTRVARGAGYRVTVLTAPPGQSCNVSNGTGSNLTADVTGVQVNCTDQRYTLGGNVIGLTGAGLQLANNGETLNVAASGPFAFSSLLGYNTAYDVSVAAQPLGQTCNVANGRGNATGNVADVEVRCAVNAYTVGGTVSGLRGGLLTLSNGSSVLTLAADGAFTFTTPVAHGSPYAVVIGTQPEGQRCTVAQGSGNATGPVSDVAVSCAPYMEGPIVPLSGTPGGVGSATFVGGGSTCRFDMAQTGFIAAPAAPPPGQALPQGMFRFRMVGCDTGSTVTVAVTWPHAVTDYIKYGSPTVGAAPEYFAPDGLSIAGQTVSFSVTDGGRGDGDAADGVITDPTGPTVLADAVAVPTLSTWALMLLSMVAAMVGGARLRQRRA